jgi:pyruvate carboxylase subunit A
VMFRKILVANRGEIAVRVIRTCAEMGIRSVAVYSEIDRHSLHVKKADESYFIGPDPLAGYLNVYRLVNLAVETGCDAIHPGYGFLSENPQFAEVCIQKGITFIGPSPDSIRRMGDKTEARLAMQRAGLPVTPGSDGNLSSLDEAIALAGRIGYPVMLKATTGGGGRGIRRCNDEEALRKNYARVISEAKKAFGSAELFMEKYILNPRHLEVQILADRHGNVIHLFERDCSIQRRNQKLIEIAPSPQISSEQRARLGEMAITAARAVGYENAGTVEFLMDEDGRLQFMEMNTRVQVEHTISEQITGVDIVQEQIRIAAGMPLRFRQEQIMGRGYAIQFRINAEDPQNDFLPSFGQITRYYAPGGPGVRTDTAIYTGYVIPPYYDSMIAKLIVWSLTWEDVVARSRRALEDMEIFGIKTTMSYYQEILNSEEFRAGTFHTGFVDNNPQLTHYSSKHRKEVTATVIASALAAYMGRW